MREWCEGLPVFRSGTLTLREVQESDAPFLTHSLSAEEVVRFISRPPDTVAAFERWIGRARTQRGEGTFVCFAIVPHGHAHAVGLIQLWRLGNAGEPSDWGLGFLLGREFWGTGLFGEAAQAALAFAFDTLHATGIKAMCAVDNTRGNRALAKLGAVCTAVALQTHDPDGRLDDFREWEIRPDTRGAPRADPTKTG
jgi:[ribosomal protein S5]-alanine N-acetyltransferase